MAEKVKQSQDRAPTERLRDFRDKVIQGWWDVASPKPETTREAFCFDWQNYLVTNLERHDVPLRYCEWRVHGYPPDWQEKAVDFIVGKDATTLFLTGGIGSKKTSFACAILLAWRGTGVWRRPGTYDLASFFVPAYEAAKAYRDVSHPHPEIEDWERAAFLVLDDLGASRFTPHLTEQLLFLIQRRYDNCLKTVITSNLSLDEIKRDIDGRAASRLQPGEGMCLDLGPQDARKETGDAISPNGDT